MVASSVIAAQHAVAMSYFYNRYRIYRMPVRWRHPTHRALGYELGTSDFSWPPPPGFTAPTMTNTPIRARNIASTSWSHGCCRPWSHREVESYGPTDEAAT